MLLLYEHPEGGKTYKYEHALVVLHKNIHVTCGKDKTR